MSDNETKLPTYELREDGEIHFNKDGHSTLLAKYSHTSGRLTFESFQIDQKHRFGIVAAVSQDPFTGRLSGRAVRSFAIAGRPADKRTANEPPQPIKDMRYGDKTPAFVKWLFKWRPQAAYARYGVLLDSNGDPQTAHCHRVEQGLVVIPEDGKPLKVFGDGRDALTTVYLEAENGILAMRQTCMTFINEERVGYVAGTEANEDEMEPLPDGEEEPKVKAKTVKAKPGDDGEGDEA